MGDTVKRTEAPIAGMPADSQGYVRMAKREGFLTLDSYHPPDSCLCEEIAASSPCPAVCRPIKVGIIGDSLVGSYDHLYPRLIQKSLKPSAYEVHSTGRVGDSAHKIMGMTEYRGEKRNIYSDWLKGGYDDVVIALGVNAIADGVTAGQLYSIMWEMCVMAMEAGAEKITLVEIAPWGGHRRWTPEKQYETLKYNEMLGVLAAELNYDFIVRGCDAEVQVARIYDALEDESRKGYSKYPRKIYGRLDRLHPSEEGLHIIANEILWQSYRKNP